MNIFGTALAMTLPDETADDSAELDATLAQIEQATTPAQLMRILHSLPTLSRRDQARCQGELRKRMMSLGMM